LKRIGLFGGTFNPIHIGHLRSAVEVRERFALDRIYMIPSAVPPHKHACDLTDASDRLEMARLSTVDLTGITVSDIEITRSGPSYTIDTVNHFCAARAADRQFFLIIGSDTFLELHTWKSYRELISRIALIVMHRPGRYDDTAGLVSVIEGYINRHISTEYEFLPDRNCFSCRGRARSIYITDITPLDISSTRIRELVRRRKSVRFLITDSVEAYIESKGLYRK